MSKLENISSTIQENKFSTEAELLKLEGTSGGIWSKPPCSCRATYHGWVPRAMSRWLLSISKAGDSTVPLGNLFQCPVTLTVKKCYLMFWQSLLFFISCLFSCHWVLMETASLWPLCLLSSGIYTHWWDPPQPSFLQTKQSQLSQPFCVGHAPSPYWPSFWLFSTSLPPWHWGTQDRTQHWTEEKDHLLSSITYDVIKYYLSL